MQKDNAFYLNHIIESIEKIAVYSIEISQEQFMDNTLIQDAIIRQLEIIGEAVKNISPEIKKADDGIPWQDIAGMRDKLIHHYFGVDLYLVWYTIKKEIPFFKKYRFVYPG